MQLTRYTDYSYRVLMYLALNPHARCTIHEIAGVFHISQNHLMKVVHQLSLSGFIKTTRGRNGGMKLARPVEKINLGEVFQAMETNQALVECFSVGTNDCVISPACNLKAAFEASMNAFLSTLSNYTLADMLLPESALRKGLGLPFTRQVSS